MRLFKYKELFRITVKNEYYTNGFCPDFTFEPTKECVLQLKNHGIKIKSMPHGIALFGEVVEDGEDEKLARGFVEDTKLTFAMKLNNPFFINFSDVPVTMERHHSFYFNNLVDNSEASELFLVSKTEIPKTSNNTALIRLSSEYYSYTHASAGDAKTGTLSFVDDGYSIDQEVENDNDEYRFHYDLTPYAPGRCQFAVDGVTDSFYAANELYRSSLFGIVEVFAKSSVPAGYQFVDSDQVVTTREYVIPFTNRSTIWRYKVYDKVTNQLSSPAIAMDGTDFNVENTAATNYPEDYACFSFTSGEEGNPTTEKVLPLTEAPLSNITLSGSFNGSSKDIIEHLPNPDIRLIKPDTDDTSKIYSEIIVYV